MRREMVIEINYDNRIEATGNYRSKEQKWTKMSWFNLFKGNEIERGEERKTPLEKSSSFRHTILMESTAFHVAKHVLSITQV